MVGAAVALEDSIAGCTLDLTNAHLPSLSSVPLDPALTALDLTANRLKALETSLLALPGARAARAYEDQLLNCMQFVISEHTVQRRTGAAYSFRLPSRSADIFVTETRHFGRRASSAASSAACNQSSSDTQCRTGVADSFRLLSRSADVFVTETKHPGGCQRHQATSVRAAAHRVDTARQPPDSSAAAGGVRFTGAIGAFIQPDQVAVTAFSPAEFSFGITVRRQQQTQRGDL